MDHTFGVMSSSRNLYLTQVHKDILLCFCLQVCSFKFRSMICFELVFFNMMWDMGSLFSNMRYPTASETFDENAKLSPPIAFALTLKIVAQVCVGVFLNSLFYSINVRVDL